MNQGSDLEIDDYMSIFEIMSKIVANILEVGVMNFQNLVAVSLVRDQVEIMKNAFNGNYLNL